MGKLISEIFKEKQIKEVGDNGIIYKEPCYYILSSRCLSSKHGANISGVIEGNCQCGNCKIKIRQYRYHEGAFVGDISHHDYVYDSEEVQSIKDNIFKQ